MTDNKPNTPLVRRLTAAARAALVPVAASVLALGGLTAWTAAGAAGRPARIEVTDAKILLPYGVDRFTAAVFTIRNGGDTGDELLSVTSPAVRTAVLARTGTASDGSQAMDAQPSVAVPARTTLAMSPYGTDVIIATRTTLRIGQKVRCVLRFRDSGRVETTAVVVRPGT